MSKFFVTAKRTGGIVAVAAAATVGAALLPAAPAMAGTSTITGVAFQDANRNGVMDSGETPLSGQNIYLLDSTGSTFLGQATTDANGAYQLTGLPDGDYRVQYSSTSWSPLRHDWTPTTTGSLWPRQQVHLAGSATADFGWRQIVRSTDASAPISSWQAPNGLTIQVYDDAVSPETINDVLLQGSLVATEASAVVIRFDISSGSSTSTSAVYDGSKYTSYRATVYIDFDSWLAHGAQTLFHEYGHAWSNYYAYLAQQDPTLSGYLQARGILNDPRVDSSYGWDRRELIAEDYRELFGNAEGAAAAQANTDLPPAATVPGLRDYLIGPFRQAVGTPTPTPTTPSPVTVSGVAVNPQPVSKSGTVSFTVSTSANATVEIRTAGGALVRTLLASQPVSSGANSVAWDRKDASGRRVRSGQYVAAVRATDAYSNNASGSTVFTVS